MCAPPASLGPVAAVGDQPPAALRLQAGQAI